ncbi:lipoate--protein ligase [Halobacteriales archaeon QS_1_68_44]|nr:MAG: lipoate--protein ligase [Halobacteriales archaeon QS_1_68_44]
MTTASDSTTIRRFRPAAFYPRRPVASGMHAVRGSLADVDRDRKATRRLAELVEECGYDPVERRVGGRAVAYTGDTVAFAHAVPTDSARSGIQERYDQAMELLEGALGGLGTTVRRGEPDRSFCPGAHSLQGDGKIAGIAQRVERDIAIIGGCVVTIRRDRRHVAEVLDRIYEALDVEFDPGTVGSVADAGGTADPKAVVGAIEEAFVGEEAETTHASDLLS